MPKGHGSGFSIGDGFIVTAAHVAKGTKELGIVTDDGRTVKAETLWVNEARDIALLRLKGEDILEDDTLACRTAAAGELIHAKGNPLGMDFITVWGRISGAMRQVGPWKHAYVGDIAILPGMSGGPVYDKDGEVIGVSIGLALGHVGFAASLTTMSYIVPSQTVCTLLARTA